MAAYFLHPTNPQTHESTHTYFKKGIMEIMIHKYEKNHEISTKYFGEWWLKPYL